MKRFAKLIEQLEQAGSKNRKVDMLAAYFQDASDSDRIIALALLGRHSAFRLKRIVTISTLKPWALESSGLPAWLFEESLLIVGDLSETITLLSPSSEQDESISLTDCIKQLILLGVQDEISKRDFIVNSWRQMNYNEKYVFNKLITGNFRPDFPPRLLVESLAKITDLDQYYLMYKLLGKWNPISDSFQHVFISAEDWNRNFEPYIFNQSYEDDIENINADNIDGWQIEHIWEGIRVQLIIRDGELLIWTDDGDLLTGKFPEFQVLANQIKSNVVLEGTVVHFEDEKPQPDLKLQSRIKRKTITKKVLTDIPVALIVHDLLEINGDDIRSDALSLRRAKLEKFMAATSFPNLELSALLMPGSHEELSHELARCRKTGSTGLIFKRKTDEYAAHPWMHCSMGSLSVHAVMIYVAPSKGRDGNWSREFTFGVWEKDEIVPITKACHGLSESEYSELDDFVKQYTIERFGPVRSVKPELVFEISFENIRHSKRHKSGITLSQPVINSWRKDLTAEQAATLLDLRQLLEHHT